MESWGSLERRDVRTGGEPARHGGSAGFVFGDSKSSCEKRGCVPARSRTGKLVACAFLFVPLAGAGVIHPADKLTEDEKISLVRDLTAEYANAKVAIPRSKKPLEFNADGTYDHMLWHDGALTMGQAARLGDKVQITKVSLEGDHILLELNHGLKSGGHWYDNVQVGMGGVGGPVGNGSASPSLGTWIQLNFHKPMENLTAADVKKILSPVLDFDKRSATVLYAETLPPEVQKAISEKRALVGMDRDQVLLALGHPDHKYRESKDGVETEDWIFGTPPGKIVFVTFNGNKVEKVKEEYAGLGSQTSPQRIP
jgi:hypothetical protein